MPPLLIHPTPSTCSFSTSALADSFFSSLSLQLFFFHPWNLRGWGCRGLIKNSTGDEFSEDVGLLPRFSHHHPRPAFSPFIHSFPSLSPSFVTFLRNVSLSLSLSLSRLSRRPRRASFIFLNRGHATATDSSSFFTLPVASFFSPLLAAAFSLPLLREATGCPSTRERRGSKLDEIRIISWLWV